jgi:hypothetical protein
LPATVIPVSFRNIDGFTVNLSFCFSAIDVDAMCALY